MLKIRAPNESGETLLCSIHCAAKDGRWWHSTDCGMRLISQAAPPLCQCGRGELLHVESNTTTTTEICQIENMQMWIECNIKWEGCNRTGRSQQKIQLAVSGKDAMQHKTPQHSKTQQKHKTPQHCKTQQKHNTPQHRKTKGR